MAPTLCNAWCVPCCDALARRGDRGGTRKRRCLARGVTSAHLGTRANAAFAPAAPPRRGFARADLRRDLRLARSGVCWGRKKKLPCREGARAVSPLAHAEHEAPASPLRAQEPAPAAHELASADEAELELAGLLLSIASADPKTLLPLSARQRASRLARCVRRPRDPARRLGAGLNARGARARAVGASAQALRRATPLGDGSSMSRVASAAPAAPHCASPRAPQACKRVPRALRRSAHALRRVARVRFGFRLCFKMLTVPGQFLAQCSPDDYAAGLQSWTRRRTSATLSNGAPRAADTPVVVGQKRQRAPTPEAAWGGASQEAPPDAAALKTMPPMTPVGTSAAAPPPAPAYVPDPYAYLWPIMQLPHAYDLLRSALGGAGGWNDATAWMAVPPDVAAAYAHAAAYASAGYAPPAPQPHAEAAPSVLPSRVIAQPPAAVAPATG